MPRNNLTSWQRRVWRRRSLVKGKAGRSSPRISRWWLMLGVSLWLCVAWTPLLHAHSGVVDAQSPQVAQANLVTQAQAEYEAANYGQAAALFEQAAMAAGDALQQGALLANASLAHQQAGDWAAANRVMQAAQDLLTSFTSEAPEVLTVRAQVQDVAAQLALAQGQAETAAIAWADAVAAYEASGRLAQAQLAQLNQAKALQTAGFYRRSIDLLVILVDRLASQPPTLTTVQAMRGLGEAYRLTGNLAGAEQQLQTSLQLAQQLNLPDEISITSRRLGDLARLSGDNADLETALGYYDQAEMLAVSDLPRFQAQLGKLHLWIDSQRWLTAYEQVLQLWESQAALPGDRSGVYVRIDFLQTLQTVRQAIASTLVDTDLATTTDWGIFVQEVFATDLNQLRRSITDNFSQSVTDNPLWYVIDQHFPSLAAVAGQLQELRQIARTLGDVQAESMILGRLGALYAQIEDWENAAQLTEQSLVLAQSYGLGQVAYELQAQLGRIELELGDRQRAIESYQASVATLQTLRKDVVAVSTEAQYSFQQSIEPIYRELATLLLTESSGEEDSGENLQQAREVIELLQLAELDNFFREACLSGETVDIDELDNRAAVLYPILLPDRLDVVVSLPNREFRNFQTSLTPDTLDEAISQLFTVLKARPNPGFDLSRVTVPASQLYDWLIRPAEQALIDSNVQTLVFVLDGSLRSIPMSVLYDGEQYLIEKYAITTTPGLRLVDPEPLPRENLSVILAGLSEERRLSDDVKFLALPNAKAELDMISGIFPSTVLFNEAFNADNFARNVGALPAPIVHLATHGQFGTTLDDTFILTWDDTLKADRFSNILVTSELSREKPIELLVLSACETAKGDELSALGLAGIAIRSGARSTLASLWKVDDRATAQLMGEFYRGLSQPDVGRAQAIRDAQLSLLRQSDFQHPFYWSGFVLLGNWL